MVIVDTHVHASPYWFEPVEVILFRMDSNRVDKATLVQYWGQTDNQYIIECTRRFPGRFSPVVIVDTDRSDAPETLKRWAKEGAEGVRLRATTRSPGNDPLAIWRTCAELNIPVSVSCRGYEEEFASDEFRKLIEALPDVTIIIEHLGSAQRDEQPPYATYRKILTLADYPNTYIKVGGLGEICNRPFPFRQPFPFEVVPPFIQMAYESFGPSRMMWGSNYPLCSQLEGYSNTLHYLGEHLTSFCSEQAKEWIFGKTALSLFKFK
ncbi:amidohydrolase family protein [Chloroflexota bacterium]